VAARDVRRVGQPDRGGVEAVGRQLTRAAAGPFPDSATELSGTDIVNEAVSPPDIFWVRTAAEPTVPCAVLTTARHVALPACAESLATTKLTVALGSVVEPRCSAAGTVARTDVTEYDGCGEPTARMATQVPIDPITTDAAVTSATARTIRERR
jgi:hypothetical protein